MKTVKMTSPPQSLAEVLRMAREDAVLLSTEDEGAFVIRAADDFETEVQLLRRNHAFLTMLDELKNEEATISLDEANSRLR